MLEVLLMDRLLWSRVHDLQFRCTAPPIDHFRTHVAQLEESPPGMLATAYAHLAL